MSANKDTSASSSSGLPRSAEDAVFTLDPCLPVHGTVRDAETKKRVEEATVEFGAVDPKTGDVLSWSSPPAVGLSDGRDEGSI